MLLLPMLVMLAFVLIAMSAARRAASRRAEFEQREYEAHLEREAATRGPSRGGADQADDADVAPFGGSPFGALLESLMTGAGARSYSFDPATGRWVDMSEHQPEAQQHEPVQQERRHEPGRRQPQSPLASLFGGGMMGGDGSGAFDVQSPEELTTFADVGGMDALKQEVRDTVWLM